MDNLLEKIVLMFENNVIVYDDKLFYYVIDIDEESNSFVSLFEDEDHTELISITPLLDLLVEEFGVAKSVNVMEFSW